MSAAKSLVPVDEALARILDGAGPLGNEAVAIEVAAGRVLAADLVANRTQPPFPASAMDGYAVRGADAAVAGVRLRLVGRSVAGAAFAGALGPGEAVRIFTGAPVPEGADTILLQENARQESGPDGEVVVVEEAAAPNRHIRPAGLDFRAGDVGLTAGTRLDFRGVSLAAAMNHARVPVLRRPKVAILSTGDELVPPGGEPGPDQIVASNHIGIAALVEAAGGEPMMLGIATDDRASLGAAIGAARDGGADVLVTLGGASVGEHDLVQAALGEAGMALDFWRIAMRPGKPLMSGRLGAMRILGLPGNPVSSLVCGLVFLKPLVAMLAGRPGEVAAMEPAVLGTAMATNDQRRDYVRSRLVRDDAGRLVATPLPVQDSSMISALTEAGCLVVREPFEAAAAAGDACRIIRF